MKKKREKIIEISDEDDDYDEYDDSGDSDDSEVCISSLFFLIIIKLFMLCFVCKQSRVHLILKVFLSSRIKIYLNHVLFLLLSFN